MPDFISSELQAKLDAISPVVKDLPWDSWSRLPGQSYLLGQWLVKERDYQAMDWLGRRMVAISTSNGDTDRLLSWCSKAQSRSPQKLGTIKESPSPSSKRNARRRGK